MKRSLLALLLFICSLAVKAQNKVDFNGGMEVLNASHQPVGWFFPKTPEQAKIYSITLDSLEKKQGKYSLAITSIPGKSAMSTSFAIPKTFYGREIELKGYMKTEAVTNGFAGLWLRVDKEEGMLQFNNMADKAITGTNDWREFSIKLPYNENQAVQILVGGLLIGQGKVWIDELRLFVDGKPLEQAKVKEVSLSKAQLDTGYARSSGIATIELNKQRITNLKTLGEVWGLVKYHHSEVAKGDFNMDAELFRVMPAVISAKSNGELNSVLSTWVDNFGLPETCKDCTLGNSEDIVQRPEYGSIFDGKVLKADLTAKLKSIVANPVTRKHYYIALVPNVGNPVFRHENAYVDMASPDAGFRLLSLYRYWNMINYFFPYKHLIGGNWADKLGSFIPVFVEAKSKQDYLITTLKLISSIHDTHANITSGHLELEQYRGRYGVPIQAKFIEEKLVVTGYYADTLNVKNHFKVGDVINRIDGVPVQKLIAKFLPITPASNYVTQLRDMPWIYLLRSNNQSMELGIVRDGEQHNLTIKTLPRTKLNYALDADPHPNEPAYKVLDGGIGYLFPGKYRNKDLPDIKNAFKDTKGIVVDMRCYPSEFMPFTFVPYIKTTAETAVAGKDNSFVKFTIGDLSRPGTFKVGEGLSVPAIGEYKGKVVVIVNERTVSQAEYTTMAMQSSSNVTVIGSTTAAADGDVSSIILPGGVYTMISGIGVLYPDGTETQRKGIRIDHEIKPTLNGIKNGKDELLEKAIEIINRK